MPLIHHVTRTSFSKEVCSHPGIEQEVVFLLMILESLLSPERKRKGLDMQLRSHIQRDTHHCGPPVVTAFTHV